jgi:undecaprenyl-diphosphatase
VTAAHNPNQGRSARTSHARASSRCRKESFMVLLDILKALVLGGIEGLTEFLPVSSTGHLLLAGHFLGFESKGKSFEVLVQLGAILAILLVYSYKILSILLGLRNNPLARRFVAAVLIAFLPAMLIGAVAYPFIKAVLFNPLIVCTMLIAGGLVLLAVEDLAPRPTFDDAMDMPLRAALGVGLCQCLAMVPGVSRSGATIVSAMFFGASKRAAAEFSFFLAMPTMAGAFAYDLFKNYKLLEFNDVALIAVGFAAAFVSGLIVVRGFLHFVSKHGFVLFAWWRIVVGVLGLAGLYFIG